jgi:hypothetical protein
MKNNLLLLLFSTLLTSCGSCEWTTEERQKFNDECPKRISIENLNVEFRGFDNKNFDSVLVQEYKDTQLTNSFKVNVDTFSSPWEKNNKSRSCTIDRKLFTNRTYKIIIDSINTYILKNMQMVVWAQGPFCPGCNMGNYTVDTTNFEHDINPTFTKKTSHK